MGHKTKLEPRTKQNKCSEAGKDRIAQDYAGQKKEKIEQGLGRLAPYMVITVDAVNTPGVPTDTFETTVETTFASCFMAGGTLAAPSLDQALGRLRSDDAWGEVRLCLRSKLTKQQLLKLAEALRKVGPIPSALATGHVLAALFRSEIQLQ